MRMGSEMGLQSYSETPMGLQNSKDLNLDYPTGSPRMMEKRKGKLRRLAIHLGSLTNSETPKLREKGSDFQKH